MGRAAGDVASTLIGRARTIVPEKAWPVSDSLGAVATDLESTLIARLAGGVGGGSCTPGSYNNEGRPQDRPLQGASYGKGSIRFFQLLEQWRAAGDFAGLTFT